MRKVAFSLAKLGLCGTTIVVIAVLFLTVHPKEGIQPAEADITDFFPTNLITGKDFTQLANNSGLRPKPYQVNGNDVYLAVGKTEMPPQEVLSFYQKRFVQAGINPREFHEVPPAKYQRKFVDIGKGDLSPDELEYNMTMLTGGVVPLVVDSEYVAMGGILPRSGAKNMDELFEGWSYEGERSGADGFRFLDAQRDEKSGLTRVTSVWSDRDFDWQKMEKPRAGDVAPDLEVPACMGCSVLMRMKSMDPKERYQANLYEATTPGAHVAAFYEKTMRNRNWQRSDANRTLDYVRAQYPDLMPRPDAELLHFTQGKRELTIAIIPDARTYRTMVTTIESH